MHKTFRGVRYLAVVLFGIAPLLSSEPSNAVSPSTTSSREIQLKLIWTGHLNAEAGHISLPEYTEAIRRFQTSIGSAPTGHLTAKEIAILKKQSAVIVNRYEPKQYVDGRTGIKIMLPLGLFRSTVPQPSRRGTEWNDAGGVVLDTLRIPLGTPATGVADGVASVSQFFINLQKMSDLREITYPSMRNPPANIERFTLEGYKGKKGAANDRRFHFHVRSNELEIRAFALSYPASRTSELERVANAMASTFDPFAAAVVPPPSAVVTLGSENDAVYRPRRPSVAAAKMASGDSRDGVPARVQSAEETRLALAIGNSAYTHEKPLLNPVNDAEDMAEALRSLGFRVKRAANAGRLEMAAEITDFGRSLVRNKAGTGLVFFAGHGLQVGGVNQLLPVDANIAELSDVDREGISLNFILQWIESENRNTVIILDACRDSPFTIRRLRTSMVRSSLDRTPSVSPGLAPVAAGAGTYIAYSTKPGSVALDGDERNSPFVKALKKHLSGDAPRLPDVMMKVRQDVIRLTNGEQLPWEEGALLRPVALKKLSTSN